eukprot:363670-Chlamydomonas_euryale.AAC.1
MGAGCGSAAGGCIGGAWAGGCRMGSCGTLVTGATGMWRGDGSAAPSDGVGGTAESSSSDRRGTLGARRRCADGGAPGDAGKRDGDEVRAAVRRPGADDTRNGEPERDLGDVADRDLDGEMVWRCAKAASGAATAAGAGGRDANTASAPANQAGPWLDQPASTCHAGDVTGRMWSSDALGRCVPDGCGTVGESSSSSQAPSGGGGGGGGGRTTAVPASVPLTTARSMCLMRCTMLTATSFSSAMSASPLEGTAACRAAAGTDGANMLRMWQTPCACGICGRPTGALQRCGQQRPAPALGTPAVAGGPQARRCAAQTGCGAVALAREAACVHPSARCRHALPHAEPCARWLAAWREHMPASAPAAPACPRSARPLSWRRVAAAQPDAALGVRLLQPPAPSQLRAPATPRGHTH